MKERGYVIEDMDRLIAGIRATYGINENEAAVRAGYNAGYISQVRSRGVVSAKFIDALRREFPEAGKVATPSPDTALIAVLVERVALLF